MRAYFFGNMYLSSIQQGIQAQHCTAELFLKYMTNEREENNPAQYLWEWANHHKTSILLNGGYSENLRVLVDRFDDSQNPYPWATFNESQEALDGALTCVGIILPEKIYALASAVRDKKNGALLEEMIRDHGFWVFEGTSIDYTKWELELALELNNYGLAS